MTVGQVEHFTKTIEVSLQDFGFPNAHRLQSGDKASADGHEDTLKLVHRVLRLIASTDSLRASPFNPVRLCPW